uniref:Hypothetical chloroplast RF1 n=1 Tax=Neodangemannia microcystis TaxID=173495 RepID=A0A1W6EHA9_9CHLO|nr:hypothetical chloroplast RF1 [Neodangemannia microcystis]ARK14797.1 hypothetical chloroplast RF1 [Neodangemannia microcystis]
MFFVSAVKDYLEILTNLSNNLISDLDLQTLVQTTFLYLITSTKFFFTYLISFEWFRNFSYLPIISPELSKEILRENFVLDTPFKNLIQFFGVTNSNQNLFLTGLGNSFFLALPLSVSHLLVFRRLVIQGVPSGLVAASGLITSQFIFIGAILFGCRRLIIPWFATEPFTFILGLFLILTIIYDMAHEGRIRPISFKEKPLLLKIFGLTFLLTWTEQSSLFQYISNLTVTNQLTILDSISALKDSSYLLNHSMYLISLTIGNIIFTGLFGMLFLNLIQLFVRFSKQPYSVCVKNLNFGILTFTLALSLTSIPYYGFDYLITNPLGFVSQDKSLEKINLRTNLPDVIGYLGQLSESKYLDTDITTFDRGRYLTDFSLPKTFEDLNYQGEYFWNSRLDRSASVTQKYRALELTPPKKEMEASLAELATSENESNISSAQDQQNNETSNTFASGNRATRTIKPNFENIDLYSGGKNDLSTKNKQILSTKLEKHFDSRTKPNYSNLLSEILDYSFNSEFFVNSGYNNPDATGKSSSNSGRNPQELALKQIEFNIKQKYYSNPLYKALLNVEIDQFLTQQPTAQKLNSSQEEQLFTNRLILTSYYDTLRDYRLLPYVNEFQNYFNGPKSYANRVYNQQFKGTLNVVRRLFEIDVNSELNKTILKFDQPLFNEFKSNTTSLYHEELNSTPTIKKLPFLENTNTTPFYAGWDLQQRKFIITNRLLPRELAGVQINKNKNSLSNNYSTLNNTTKIRFTSWPTSTTSLNKKRLPYVLVPQEQFNSVVANLGLEDHEFGFTNQNLKLPPNIQSLFEIVQIDMPKVLPPQNGGFIW